MRAAPPPVTNALMKRVLLYALVLCCLSSPAPAQGPPAGPNEAPRPAAPAVKVEPAKVITDELFGRELKDILGRSFSLSDYRGRVFVVNLWATWCAPCRLEMPGLNKLYGEYGARGVEFVGLTSEDPAADAETVCRFAAEFGVKYKLGWLDAETARELTGGRYVLPQTFVVGADGRVVLHIRGYNPAVPEMVRAGVERALTPADGPKPAAPPPPAAPAPPVSRP